MYGEAWLPIPGYETRYEVSSFGRIRSLSRVEMRSNGKRLPIKERIMSAITNPVSKYQFVNLADDQKKRPRYVHDLVALSFIGPKSKDLDVRHLNRDKSDNRFGNLLYGTRSENILDSIHLTRGEKHYNSKLTESQVLYIRKSSGKSQRALAKELGVNQSTICDVRTFKKWAWL